MTIQCVWRLLFDTHKNCPFVKLALFLYDVMFEQNSDTAVAQCYAHAAAHLYYQPLSAGVSRSTVLNLLSAAVWPCCCHSPPDLHVHTNAGMHAVTQAYHERAHTHTFRCGWFGMQEAQQECSLALTVEAVWQVKNKTRKWRLEKCLIFLLTFPVVSLYGANR